MTRNSWLAGTLAIVLSTAGAALAQTAPAPAPQAQAPPQATVPQSDMLLATLWRSARSSSRATRSASSRSPHPPRRGAGRQELDGGAGRAEGRLRRTCRPRSSSISTRRARQLALPGVDAEGEPELQHQDLGPVLRRPGVDRDPGRRWSSSSMPSPRASRSSTSPTAASRPRGHAREHGEARLPDGRQRRHLPDAEREAGLGQRQGHPPRRDRQGLSRRC